MGPGGDRTLPAAGEKARSLDGTGPSALSRLELSRLLLLGAGRDQLHADLGAVQQSDGAARNRGALLGGVEKPLIFLVHIEYHYTVFLSGRLNCLFSTCSLLLEG